jgi:DNA modification methylase
MTITILRGDCREVMRGLPDNSVHCVVTSPPYFGLRDYGTATWEGGDAACAHRADDATLERQNGRSSTLDGATTHQKHAAIARTQCKCGAHRIDNQIGLEPTPDAFVAEMVAVFREVRRVLRDDGTCWLNLGDSYAGSGKYSPDAPSNVNGSKQSTNMASAGLRMAVPNGLKGKDLIGIPWRVAFALQADGWYLRQDIIWSKPNPMPESVRDRCTKAHEYLFLLSKSERYYYDADAIAEDALRAGEFNNAAPQHDEYAISRVIQVGETRNKRSVWSVATQPYSDAHFATFPPALIEPCILAGCPERVCANCGAPWVREVEKTRTFESGSGRAGNMPVGKNGASLQGGGETLDIMRGPVVHTKTLGWDPSCSCNTETNGGTCLDPFGGAGTTGLVADRLGRNAILIELNPDYAEMAEQRIRGDCPLFVEIDRQRTMTDGWYANATQMSAR